MGKIKLGVGTFIVREDAQRNLGETLGKLAAIGYDGVELIGFFGRSAETISGLLSGLSIEALGDHIGVTDFLAGPERVLADHRAIGCKRITLGCSGDQVAAEPFEALAEQMGRAADACLAAGITPMYHNHAFDMQGEMPFAERMLDAVPQLRFEPDIGWMLVGGQDVARLLRKYRDRTSVVHLKDVFVSADGFTFRPTGYGNVNTPGLMPDILACEPEWLVVDHDDAYARSSYDDLALSYEYVRALLRVIG